MNKRLVIAAQLLAALLCAQTARAENSVFAYPQNATELTTTLLAQPVKAMANVQVLRGKFVLRKFLSDIPAPLEANGEFVFIRDTGLYWNTLQPFASVFVLTSKAMTQRDEGGKALTVDAREQPAVHAAAQIFVALFAVDVVALNADFNLFGMKTDKGWQLGLRPKNAALNAVFTEAIVSGAGQVEQVELRDAQGDRTVIQIHDGTLLGRAPTAAERALFAP
jgi:outer membrane lipoprotein-sorting protein